MTNETGFDLNHIDTFKRYYGYETKYIIESWVRYKYKDTIIAAFDTLDDMLAYGTDQEQEGFVYMYVTDDGQASDYLDY